MAGEGENVAVARDDRVRLYGRVYYDRQPDYPTLVRLFCDGDKGVFFGVFALCVAASGLLGGIRCLACRSTL